LEYNIKIKRKLDIGGIRYHERRSIIILFESVLQMMKHDMCF